MGKASASQLILTGGIERMHSKTERIVVFAGYREWASAILANLQASIQDTVFIHVKTEAALNAVLNASRVDAVFLVGWSWILPTSLLKGNFVVGLHPSDLPNYAGGSPLQHQIIDGLTKSKMSLFEITPKLDSGRVFLQANLSLEGQMWDVFASMVSSGSELLIEALSNLDALKERVGEGTDDPFQSMPVRRRLLPSSSCINKEDVPELSAKQLYNLIRARGKPYPNAYIEDETGRLYFQCVRFELKL